MARATDSQAVPLSSALPGSERRVLAALAGAPLGLSSLGAVARRADLSDSLTARAVSSLEERGLVQRRTGTLAEGAARVRTVWCVNTAHPEWPALAPTLSPAAGARDESRRTTGAVPPRLAHVFWNEDLAVLDPDLSGGLIAKRVLQARDPQALSWAAHRLRGDDWDRAAGARGLDPRDISLARHLAAAARRRDG